MPHRKDANPCSARAVYITTITNKKFPTDNRPNFCRYTCLSSFSECPRYSRNFIRPGTMFMLVPGIVQVCSVCIAQFAMCTVGVIPSYHGTVVALVRSRSD
jgi:hypothetical protein